MLTKVLIIWTFTLMASLLLRTLDNIETPCSVKTYGSFLRPPCAELEITFCDIKFSHSASQVYAAPILNQNMAADGTFVTIWPDHLDPDHFYFAPNFMKIAVDAKRNVKFHFTQYKSGNCNTRLSRNLGRCQYKALITSLMISGYEQQQLSQAQAGILKIRPKARFSAIPFLSSKVEFGSTLTEFIDQHECSPRAGQAADEIPCSVTLNKRGMTYLMPFLNSGRILPFKFIYQIAGVIEGANKEYKDASLDYGLTVNLGGEMLIQNPELDVPFIWEE